MTLVSVVITTYKRPDRLAKAIETVTEQTYKNLEIIVVDGANSEENKKVAESSGDERMKYVEVEPEYIDTSFWVGIQHARNVGCKATKGKYIAMLDDDDTWRKDKIEKQLKEFKDKKVALVVSYTKTISGKNCIIDKTKTKPKYEDLLQSFNFSSTSSYMIRKDVLEEILGWNEDLRGMHEYDIALKMAKKGYRIITIPEPLVTRTRIANQVKSYYYIKIAEVIDFWRYFGKDFFPKLGLLGFLFNVTKTVGLFSLFITGFIIKEKVWDIIYPLKTLHSQRKLL